MEIADPKFAPIIIPKAISKVINPLDKAVNVSILEPVLVCNTTVITRPIRILLNKPSPLSASEKLVDKISTLSFIYPNPKKSNPNQIINFAAVCNFL